MAHRKLRSARMIGVLSLIVSACALLLAPAMASAAVTGISGKVTNVATSAPIEGIDVCAYTASTETLSGCAFTNGSGEYTISGLSETHYKVEFRSFSGTYATQWYNGKTSFATANEVAVTTNNTTPNINAAMQETTGKISGTVTDAGTHGALNNIEVCAEPASYSEEFYSYGCARTNASGEYTISSLHPGSYKVDFFSPGKYNETTEKLELESNYVAQYYNGKMHRSEADAVTVTEGVTTSGINAAMQAGATITGTVTDATTNAALEGVEVCAWGSNVYYCETTDGSGNYSIKTVAAGSYKVEFNPNTFYVKYNKAEPEKEHWARSELPLANYLRQYWNDKFSFEAAEAITATSGATASGINAKMTKEVQPPPPAGVAKVGPKAKVKGGKALLQVKCTGTGACSGLIKLSARAPKAPKKKGKSHKKGSGSVAIGKAHFSIPPGKSKTVAVKLNGKGKALVKQAGAKGLKATVVGTGVSKGSVTLKGQSSGKKKK